MSWNENDFIRWTVSQFVRTPRRGGGGAPTESIIPTEDPTKELVMVRKKINNHFPALWSLRDLTKQTNNLLIEPRAVENLRIEDKDQNGQIDVLEYLQSKTVFQFFKRLK
jgi:hypothetical protein